MRTPAERTLAAEVRAVTYGHHARLDHDGRRFLVKSETNPDVTHHVRVFAVGEVVMFECDHVMRHGYDKPSVTFVPCMHGALCARRLERRNLLRWENGRWLPTERAYRLGLCQRPTDDPFEGLPQ